ncbi:putative ubiquinone biosynthesis protein COQ9 [Podospora australis]|uniref:Ubiquinone biosynthesis protein n=1 Tax=Podospora australis TaxID=1536484 RepID=A0AAN6WLQ7_9PEZI|nr:putative ubiquinone biosynthesis protein COQ9 [Podospora australis]
MASAAVTCSAGAARRMLLLPPRPTVTLLRPSVPVTRSLSTTANHSSVCRHSHTQQQSIRSRHIRPESQRTPASQLQTRAYHSHDHPAPPRPFTEAETTLLSAALQHVPEHGFGPEALAHGARDVGLLDISAAVLPDGPFSLIRYHLYAQRTGLAAKKDDLFQGTEAIMTVSEKVEALTWARLRGNEVIIGKWQEALAIMAMPSQAPTAAKELGCLADEIYYLAGDLSVDPSWYTKRASLSAIYAATELFMTTDRSPGFQETRAFLRRRLDEASSLGGAVRSVSQWLSFTGSAAVNVLRSKGVRI